MCSDVEDFEFSQYIEFVQICSRSSWQSCSISRGELLVNPARPSWQRYGPFAIPQDLDKNRTAYFHDLRHTSCVPAPITCLFFFSHVSALINYKLHLGFDLLERCLEPFAINFLNSQSHITSPSSGGGPELPRRTSSCGAHISPLACYLGRATTSRQLWWLCIILHLRNCTTLCERQQSSKYLGLRNCQRSSPS